MVLRAEWWAFSHITGILSGYLVRIRRLSALRVLNDGRDALVVSLAIGKHSAPAFLSGCLLIVASASCCNSKASLLPHSFFQKPPCESKRPSAKIRNLNMPRSEVEKVLRKLPPTPLGVWFCLPSFFLFSSSSQKSSSVLFFRSEFSGCPSIMLLRRCTFDSWWVLFSPPIPRLAHPLRVVR